MAWPGNAVTGHIGVVTDSASDLPNDVVTRLGVQIVPLSIRFGDEEFVDREELTTDEFWARCKASPTHSTTTADAARWPGGAATSRCAPVSFARWRARRGKRCRWPSALGTA